MLKADLSDICDFVISAKNNNESSTYHILVLRISEGKQNNDKNIYCRLLRHKDPRLCGIGALAMYLFLRFNLTQEYKLFDFSTTVHGLM